MTTTVDGGRGKTWFFELAGEAPLAQGYPGSVLVADASLAGRPARFIAVVPDPDNRFPRARNGEVGLLEGWQVARAVQELVAAERGQQGKSAIVAVIDVPSQAYGLREEAFGIHQALAGAAGAYATARLAGHPVIGLIVGNAISGGFLAHGYQANRLIAFNDPQVSVHAMGKESAARITLRSVEALESLAATVPPMAYDIVNYASLGLLWRTLDVDDPDRPGKDEVNEVLATLEQALADIEMDPDRSLQNRLGAPNREASARVRDQLRRQWAEDRLPAPPTTMNTR
jgi:malonate decarboxylase gamma subunit